jgi:beta-phosphoglucomutase
MRDEGAYMTQSSNLPRAVLWDADGTLFDSMEYHWQAWHATIAAENHELTREQFEWGFGRLNASILRNHLGADLPDGEVERISEAKEQRYRALVRANGIELLPGVRTWLDRLKANGWRQAIASSAPRANLDVILAALKLSNWFDAVVGAEDVTRGKPDPQVYLIAAQRLEVPPARCLVIEDAAAGIEGAQRAGMQAIGVGPNHARLGAAVHARALDQLSADTPERLVSEE